MYRHALSRLALISFLVFPTLVLAKVDPCERYLQPSHPITLQALKEASAKRIADAERIVPRPGFTDISVEATREQVGEKGPIALQEFLSPGQSFVSTPAPTAADVSAVNMVEEARSVVIHTDIEWEGQRTSTALYVSLPAAKVLSAGKYLVDSEYPVALVFLHGGGTPTATGKNGMTLGEKLTALNIPVISPDMPGHGRATRKVNGFAQFKQQVDWLMKILEQNVHPGVKLVLSGHSWGGEFAVYMHRLSKDPKYDRIVKYIAVSPPVDVTLGGDLQKKLEHERWYEENYHLLKDRIGPSDFEFRENVLSNGKDSDVGGYHTAFTFMDYMLPVLTPEQQAELKDFSIAVGTADGMVYVGFEEAFEALFGKLSKKDYLLLGPGQTWKGEEPTAHNVWDRYIDGTTTLQMYDWIGEQVLAQVGGQKPELPKVDKPTEVVDAYFRNYANFFAFRELVAAATEYVRVETPYAYELGQIKRELDEYIKRADSRQSNLVRDQDLAVRKAIEGLRAELGLENINVARARQELELKPLTEERRHELESYVQKVTRLEEDLRARFTDPQYDRDIAALTTKFAKLVAKLNLSSIENYKEHFDHLQSLKQLTKEESALRSELSQLHQEMVKVNKRKQEHFGIERDRLWMSVPAPSGVTDHKMAQRELTADRSPERRPKLEAFVARYNETEAQARQQVEAQIAEDVAAIPKPEGVTDPEQARRKRYEIDAMLSFTYAPSDPEIDSLARKISGLEDELQVVARGDEKRSSLEKLETSVWQLRVKRNNLVGKKWANIWKNDLTSEEYAQKRKHYDQALESYKQIYFNYSALKSQWLLELKQAGHLDSEHVLASTPELKSLLGKLVHTRDVFFHTAEELEFTKWTEAIKGNLQGPEAVVKEAQKLAIEVWGEDYPGTHQASKGSLTQTLRREEEYLESRRREESLLDRQLNELRYEYAQKMHEQGKPFPFRMERVNIYQELNRPLKDLISDLQRDKVLLEAMTKTLSRWERMQSELRREAHLKGNIE